MITEQQIHGGWTELKGKVKETWGDINDDKLKAVEGNVDQLIGLIERETGEARANIEKQLQDLDERFRPYVTQAVNNVKRYAEETANQASEQVDRLKHQVAAGHAEAQHYVRSRPMESVAVAFGAGIVAGVVLGLVSRTR